MSETTRDGAMEMARVLGLADDLWKILQGGGVAPRTEIGLALAEAEQRGAAREREACAALAEGRSVAGGPLHTAGWHRACKDIAAAIRARGQGEGR